MSTVGWMQRESNPQPHGLDNSCLCYGQNVQLPVWSTHNFMDNTGFESWWEKIKVECCFEGKWQESQVDATSFL